MTNKLRAERDPKQRWNARYAGAVAPGQPAPLLLKWLPRLPRGRALDFACGTGANTLALADAGFVPVIGIDLSIVGLKIGARAARQHALQVDWIVANLESYALPTEAFDLICVFRYLDRMRVDHLINALRPGGALIYQTFTVGQIALGYGPRTAEHLLEPGELRALFAPLQLLHYREGIDSRQGRPEATAELVGLRVDRR
jgi:tellurite methyltransferase